MKINEAYNIWADQYDTNINKTRDLEAISLRKTLQNFDFQNCLEIGCGTGKNTEWLIEKANLVTAVDFSYEMLAKAKAKIQSDKVEFIQADITKEWDFAKADKFDLVTFSLVLEHIENLNDIFQKVKHTIQDSGLVYIGELHPFKQYTGTKARFDTAEGTQVLTCFTHNVSDFATSAKQYGFQILEINEYFDDNDRTNIPRILTLLIQKEES